MNHEFDRLARKVSELEARLTLSESAIAVLLGVLTRTNHEQAALAHAALKVCTDKVIQGMSDLATDESDKRVSQTANAFLDLTNKDKAK